MVQSLKTLLANPLPPSLRPRVGREEFVLRVETLAQIGAESVIHRAAVGVIRVHVAEGDASGKGGGIAGIEPEILSQGGGLCDTCGTGRTQ